MDEVIPLVKQMDMMVIEGVWALWGPMAPTFNVHWPWVKGYGAEGALGGGRYIEVFARTWIAQELKAAMGFYPGDARLEHPSTVLFPSGLWGGSYMEVAPWLAIWPGVFLTITVYSLNMFGDALRDLLDPRLRGGRGRLGADAARTV